MLTLKKFSYSKNWYIRGSIKGRRILESTGTDNKRQAEQVKAKREKEIFDAVVLGQLPPCTFPQAVDAYIKRGGETKYLPKLLTYFKDRSLSQIGQLEIDNAAAALYPDAKASTVNRQLINVFISVARAAFKAELPGAALRPIDRRKETKVTVRPATDDHIFKLLPECDDGLAALLVLMTYTGLRTGEALRVEEKDLIDGFIHIETTKNGEPRMVPIPDGWTYPQNGFGYKTTQGVGKAIRAATARAGLEYRRGHEIGRHAFAARWLANKGTLLGLAKAGDWKSLKVAAGHYGHLEQSHVHDTMRELSKRKGKTC